MKVKTIVRFRDLEADKIRDPGEEFTVGEKRADKLKSLGLVEEMKEKEKQAAE